VKIGFQLLDENVSGGQLVARDLMLASRAAGVNGVFHDMTGRAEGCG